jgi:hypothetical protein
MKLDNNYIGLLGHVILAIAYGLFIKDNLSKDKLIIFGSVLILIGYLTTSIENSIKLAKKTKQIHTYNYGHIILTIFYFVSFLYPINDHRKDSDVLALVGHILLIKNNELEIFGKGSLIVYYVLYVMRNFKEFEFLPNKIQVVGGSVAVIYYILELFVKVIKDKIQ